MDFVFILGSLFSNACRRITEFWFCIVLLILQKPAEAKVDAYSMILTANLWQHGTAVHMINS